MSTWKCSEVMKALKVGKSTAYTIIRDLNKELQEKGYRTISGRIESSYLLHRYGMREESKGE